jgi:Ankyrin repeats (3 copies)
MSQALFAAIRSGNVKRVTDALATGADPNARNKSGTTALAAALTHESFALAEALIAAGADVNVPDGDGLRPLDLAILYCGPRAVQHLVDQGAEVNYIRSDGDPAIIAAAGPGDSKLVEIFLAAGADPNTPRAIDGLSVADIHVICAQSRDIPAGMKRQSAKILDLLRAAGATIRTMDEIEAIKDAQYRRTAAEEGADELPPDPAPDEVKRFAAAAKSAAFLAVLDELSALCKSPPKHYRPAQYGLHRDADGVYLCRFDRAKLRAHFGKAKGDVGELLSDLGARVLARGFYLVQNTDVEGENDRLLLPTVDPFAVVCAHVVTTNGAVDEDELLAGLRKVYALAPFVVTDCGHDRIGASYLHTISRKKSEAIDQILNEICEIEDDFDEDEFEADGHASAEELRKAAEEDRRAGFYLWWD